MTKTAKASLIGTAAAVASMMLLLETPSLNAIGSQTWRLRERSDFEKGEPKGVSLAADGALRLSPRLDLLYESEQPYIWALALDAHGTIYASGGNEGIVYRIRPSGKGEVFFRAEEPEVHALALDGAGHLYAAASPGGRIYKIAPDGKRVWTCDTGEKYVWALILDRQGNLFAGTGVEGRILAIDAAGHSEVYFDSAETHIRTLALDGEGHLLAGSDGHGLVFQIPSKNEGRVLYDAPLNEVAALVPAPDGTIYAAIVGEGGRSTPRGERLSPPPPPGGAPGASAPSEGAPASPPQQGTSTQPEQAVSVAMEGKVFAISPDGYGRELWSSGQEAILSLELSSAGNLLMGSSQQGKIYALDSQGNASEIARASSSQVTSLLRRGGARSPGGRGRAAGRGPRAAAAGNESAVEEADDVVVAGSNLGTIAALRPGFASSGTYESRVLDARVSSTWGRVTWRADLPKGTAIVLNSRSGNTEEPDRTWTKWGADLSDPQGSLINAPPARFLQWRAALKTGEPARTPELSEVAVTYLQRNLPPEIRKIEVQAPGVSLQKIPAVSAVQGGENKPPPGASETEGVARRRARPQSRRGFEPGARSVTWQTSDPNDDELVYDVFYRAVDEKSWKKIRSHVDEDFITLDSAAMPDGTYMIRVIASDAPSNPSGQALTAEKFSERFDVDNTPPRVEGVKIQTLPKGATLSFSVSDSFSIVRDAVYAVDAGDWVPARPEDGLNDSQTEKYAITIPSLTPGEHSIVVRATDAAGNVGAGKTVVEVP